MELLPVNSKSYPQPAIGSVLFYMDNRGANPEMNSHIGAKVHISYERQELMNWIGSKMQENSLQKDNEVQPILQITSFIRRLKSFKGSERDAIMGIDSNEKSLISEVNSPLELAQADTEHKKSAKEKRFKQRFNVKKNRLPI